MNRYVVRTVTGMCVGAGMFVVFDILRGQDASTYLIHGAYDSVTIYRDHEDIVASYKANSGRSFFICAHFDKRNARWDYHS